MNALVHHSQVPRAWKVWALYRMNRDMARERLVFHDDNPPIYPFGRCPAKETFG